MKSSSSMLVRNFSIFTLLLVGCMVSLGIYAMRASQTIDHADSWVTHTRTIIGETQAVITGVHQMLSAQRGYLLTGDSDYIDRYTKARDTAREQVARVRALSVGNSSHEMRLEDISEKLEIFSDTLEESFDEMSVAPDLDMMRDKELVTSLHDHIVRESQIVLRQEYDLLNARAASLAQKTRDYRNTLFIGGAGSALLLLLLNGFLLKAQSGRGRAERSLREAEDRLSLAVRGSSSGVFDIDLLNNTSYWSEQYKHILGYEDSELDASTVTFADMLHPDERDQVIRNARQYVTENLSEYADIFRMRHKSGRWIWIQARGIVLFDDEKKPSRFIGTHTDITHLKDYERRLEEERDRAEKANAAKSEFLAHMSHEIRTPLTAINGIAEILSTMQQGLNEKQIKLIHTLSSSAISLKDLVTDILDFSKIESGEIEMSERQFDLGSLFEQVISITSVKAAEKQLDYTVEYDSLVYESFYGDQGRIRQILINLIGNAIKFTDRGFVRVTAERQMIDKIPVLAVTVKDSGIGISADGMKIIFDKFRQADASVSRKYGGTGLGLPISRKLAELMGGTIKVESTASKGSIFTLYLPFKERDVFYGVNRAKPDAAIAEQKQQDRLLNILEEKRKVLLVEDYEGNIVVLSHLLEEMGVDYDVARTGVEALDRWKSGHYHLILMDVQMPEMDGLTATREIRAMEESQSLPQTPIIGLTAHAMVADREKCIASGMNTYLPKPIDEAELKRTIIQFMEKQPGDKHRAA